MGDAGGSVGSASSDENAVSGVEGVWRDDAWRLSESNSVRLCGNEKRDK